MPSYLPASIAPFCRCKGNPLQQMLCSTGHWNECHYPLDCQTAGCSRLVLYDLDPDTIQELEDAADRLYASLANTDCPYCDGSGFRGYVLHFPDGEEAVLHGVCDCLDVAELSSKLSYREQNQ